MNTKKTLLLTIGFCLFFTPRIFAQQLYTPSSVYFQSPLKQFASSVAINKTSYWVQTKELILKSSEIPACRAGCLVKVKTEKISFGELWLTLNDQPVAFVDSNDPDGIMPNLSFRLSFKTNMFGKKTFTTYLDLDHLQRPDHANRLRPLVKICSKHPGACGPIRR